MPRGTCAARPAGLAPRRTATPGPRPCRPAEAAGVSSRRRRRRGVDRAPASSKSSCQANGCYGGWYCDTSDNKCREAPSSCTGMTSCGGGGTSTSTGGSGGMVMVDAGGPVSGTITGNGGRSRASCSPSWATRGLPTRTTRAATPPPSSPRSSRDIAAMQPRPSFVVVDGRLPVRLHRRGTRVGAAARDLHAAPREVLGPVLPGDGQPRVHGPRPRRTAAPATPTA